jgi:hypothetical protein
VLKAGGRLAISDVVAVAPIPPELQTRAAALAGCISGAAPLEDLKRMLEKVGFVEIRVTIAPRSAEIVDSWLAGASKYIASATIEARRADPDAQKASSACCEPSCCT